MSRPLLSSAVALASDYLTGRYSHTSTLGTKDKEAFVYYQIHAYACMNDTHVLQYITEYLTSLVD